MKFINPRWLCGVALIALLSGVAAAQTKLAGGANNRPQDDAMLGRLQMGDLDRLEAKAKQVVEVTIDQRMIRFIAGTLSAKDPQQAQIKEVVLGLKGIYVRSYQFDDINAYAASDVEAMRRQIKTPLWSRIVGVRSPKGQNVEVFAMFEGEKMNGLSVIAAEPKSFTVVNIVGFIDIEKLRLLEGNFGIPKLEINGGDKDDKKKDAKPAPETKKP